jgi:hypothetical protein
MAPFLQANEILCAMADRQVSTEEGALRVR